VHGVLQWFDLYTLGNIKYSTQPFDRKGRERLLRQSHWWSPVHIVRTPLIVEAGGLVNVSFAHSDYCIEVWVNDLLPRQVGEPIKQTPSDDIDQWIGIFNADAVTGAYAKAIVAIVSDAMVGAEGSGVEQHNEDDDDEYTDEDEDDDGDGDEGEGKNANGDGDADGEDGPAKLERGDVVSIHRPWSRSGLERMSGVVLVRDRLVKLGTSIYQVAVLADQSPVTAELVAAVMSEAERDNHNHSHSHSRIIDAEHGRKPEVRNAAALSHTLSTVGWFTAPMLTAIAVAEHKPTKSDLNARPGREMNGCGPHGGPLRVLDLGGGHGLLTMLALRATPAEQEVFGTVVELSAARVNRTTQTLLQNGIQLVSRGGIAVGADGQLPAGNKHRVHVVECACCTSGTSGPEAYANAGGCIRSALAAVGGKVDVVLSFLRLEDEVLGPDYFAQIISWWQLVASLQKEGVVALEGGLLPGSKHLRNATGLTKLVPRSCIVWAMLIESPCE
jgi:hypothetical protein